MALKKKPKIVFVRLLRESALVTGNGHTYRLKSMTGKADLDVGDTARKEHRAIEVGDTLSKVELSRIMDNPNYDAVVSAA